MYSKNYKHFKTSVCSLSISCRYLVGFLSILCLFTVNVCLGFCRYSVRILSVFFRYSVRILSVLLCVITGSSTSLLYASGLVDAQVVRHIVSSHLLNASLIVPLLNIMICNQTCTVIYNTVIISKLIGRNACLISVYFLSICFLFPVDVWLVFCRYIVRIQSVFGPCYLVCS